MIYNKVTTDYEILFKQHEFPTPNGLLVIKNGDTWIVNNKGIINILGYGIIDNGFSLKFIFKNYKETFSIDISELKQLLIDEDVTLKRFIDSDNNSLFSDRVNFPYDTTKLETFLANMNGIILKTTVKNKRKYALPHERIGTPDWVVVFRYTTNKNGSFSFSKIVTLAKEFPGNVFINGHSTRGVEDFLDSNSIFFSLSGISVSPDQCLSKLLTLTNK